MYLKTIKNEAKELKGGFLGASLLRNLLTDKGTIKAGEVMSRAGEGKIRAFQDF